MSPRKPAQVHPLATKLLDELSKHPVAAEIVLGGYFALQHYLHYRETQDIDAWWRTRASAGAADAIRQVMSRVAAEEQFELRERRFGDTHSFELWRRGRKEFSFQIAVRSVELEPPVPSPWPPILIETLADNVAAKMNALVERGAPRDFRDIVQVVQAGLITASQCWELWLRKNPGQSVAEARSKAAHHLMGIAARRPLESIPDATERCEAEKTRNWFTSMFLKA